MKKIGANLIIAIIAIATLIACKSKKAEKGTTEVSERETKKEDGTGATTGLLKISKENWSYNADDNVYYQIGVPYCEDPADENYENLAIFVPGDYFTASENSDGTYTCEINTNAKVGDYNADTAPIVMPINTPGYSAQAALTEYSSVKDYTDAGFVYVHAGCRGRDAGAPAGVTDLKSAVRYIRYCDDVLPGSAESIFTFGMSGGGAQSAIMGSAGDSELYDKYLKAIGTVQGVSNAVKGAMCWCPITNLDTADEAYEWMLATTRSGLSEDEQKISDSLAKAFPEYINTAGIKDNEGNVLKLEESSEGIYQAGSYYDYMLKVIEGSLNNFLSDTTFPYDASSSSGGGMAGGTPTSGEMPSGDMPSGEAPSGEKPLDAAEKVEQSTSDTSESQSYEEIDDIIRNETSSGISLSGTYENAADYIAALNENGEWVKYDSASNTVKITSIKDFVKALKSASKNLGAFDQLDAGQGENTLFGYGDGSGAHFDATLANILTELGNSYASNYIADLSKEDAQGNTVDTRLNMYTPLYYLLDTQKGYGTSNVAKFWRIRTGINQGDCALSTEMNLALAVKNYSSDSSVDFETVWGQGHTMAERSGDSTSNFITWVNECMKT